jgi:MFS family permease
MTQSPPGPSPADEHTSSGEWPVPERRPGTQRLRRTARATARGARVAGQATARAGRATFTGARRASHAHGAGQSGLYRIIELHAVGAAGDAFVAVSLAGTLFFQVPTGEARGQVALFLGLTMLPFVVVAPLIGPFLDRFSHGRRWAIGATMAVRAFLCWVLAGAVAEQSPVVFAAALGCLVAGRAYGVTRAAALPRVLPSQLTLVKANSRIGLAGIVGAAIGAPVAAGLAQIGPEWALRGGFVVFVLGTILAILLPAAVDTGRGDGESGGHLGIVATLRSRIPSRVVVGLRANTGLRLLSGFLVLYLAFLLREHPLEGWSDRGTLLLGIVAAAAGAGNLIGIALGNARAIRPERGAVVALLLAAVLVVVAAFALTAVTAAVLALVAGLTQGYAKLAVDALIQEEVPDRGRTSAFARSETALQLAWVLGGFIGIAMPLVPAVGLGGVAAILAGTLVWAIVGLRGLSAAGAGTRARS